MISEMLLSSYSDINVASIRSNSEAKLAMNSDSRWFTKHEVLTLCHVLPAIATIDCHPSHWSDVLGGLEPGVPSVTAWFDVHVYVATCQTERTRDPPRCDPIHVSWSHVVGQGSPSWASKIKPSLGTRSTSREETGMNYY